MTWLKPRWSTRAGDLPARVEPVAGFGKPRVRREVIGRGRREKRQHERGVEPFRAHQPRPDARFGIDADDGLVVPIALVFRIQVEDAAIDPCAARGRDAERDCAGQMRADAAGIQQAVARVAHDRRRRRAERHGARHLDRAVPPVGLDAGVPP